MNGGDLDQPWRKGDEITATRLEAMRRGVAAGDAGGPSFADSTGIYRRPARGQDIELWEVYSCELDAESHEYKIEAYPVACDDSGLWRANTAADLETLWFPAAFHDTVSPYGAIGPKSFGPGRRVYTRLLDGRRCIIACPVEQCRFELKTALAPGGSATAMLRTWTGSTWATDPLVEFPVYDLLGIHRGRASATLPGSIGVAEYCELAQRWYVLIMQPMAMLLWASVNESSGVAPTAATFAVDACSLLQPIGGILDAMPNQANNPLGLALADNDKVLLAWNETAVGWDAIASGQVGGHAWGKVQTGFANAAGDASRTVSVKACAWDGSGEAGDAFDVKTPIRANKDTALFTGYVVRYTVEAGGTLLIDSDCFDDPLGTGRWVNQDDAVRDGWEEVAAVRDRFVKGKAAAEDYEDTGGDWPAAHGDHTITPTMTCINAPAGAGVNVYGFADADDTTLDHTNNHDGTKASGPPWYTQKFIRRTS